MKIIDRRGCAAGRRCRAETGFQKHDIPTKSDRRSIAKATGRGHVQPSSITSESHAILDNRMHFGAERAHDASGIARSRETRRSMAACLALEGWSGRIWIRDDGAPGQNTCIINWETMDQQGFKYGATSTWKHIQPAAKHGRTYAIHTGFCCTAIVAFARRAHIACCRQQHLRAHGCGMHAVQNRP
ncbi:MAG: hypothetical protein ABI407_19440 [Bradyrhizobium sp.]